MVKKISLNLDGAIGQINSVNPVFARHETFHPRFGWLKKGFDAAQKNSGIFLEDDAPIRLGVGKNMVNAIRYWCNAFKVLEDDMPTEFGKLILGDNGWDSFLEDPASLWLLHWNLLKPPCNATAWYFAFNIFRQFQFSQDEFFNALCDYKNTVASRIVESSVKKDVSCILRMYVEQAISKAGVSEDTLDCPFTELGIIHTAGDSRYYSFRVGAKGTLPPEIVVAACLEYASWVGREQRTISISRLLYNIGSPGMAFKLTESAICEAIERVERQFNSIALSESAGLIQFSYNSEPEQLANAILDNYYKGRSKGANNE
ncbi:MAG TPA: DUF4007 domain-containing protein [Cyanobacteria bacterium UBA12227]|nr:DUF4007 domain-containing protein [Cyanobacteria bacterium UBA12227]HAX84750.1 DUF4007 domain-containing protein [Cyanobacteria bacterium UBA11370]HBY81553.1 DUF4007 domain-containing protein [Cyanobacteria bacterium UBA11148]